MLLQAAITSQTSIPVPATRALLPTAPSAKRIPGQRFCWIIRRHLMPTLLVAKLISRMERKVGGDFFDRVVHIRGRMFEGFEYQLHLVRCADG
jgi:hypothetical protein